MQMFLRAASPKYQLDLEIAKKIEFLQTRPEWSPTGTSYKNIVLSSINQKKNFFRNYFVSMLQIGQNPSKMSGIFGGS